MVLQRCRDRVHAAASTLFGWAVDHDWIEHTPVQRIKKLPDRWNRAAAAVTILTNTLGRPWMPQHLSHELPGAPVEIGLRRDLNVHGLLKLMSAERADAGS